MKLQTKNREKFVISLISIFVLANNDLIKIIFNIKYLMFKVILLELHYYCNLIMEKKKKKMCMKSKIKREENKSGEDEKEE